MGKNTGGWLMLAAGLLLTARVGLNLVRLYRTGDRLDEAEVKLEESRRENRELTDRLAEVQTPEFLEREAREKLGLGREGEVVVIIPEEELTAVMKGGGAAFSEEPNWLKWRKLYLGW